MKKAILIPCYNEEKTIAQVIDDCQKYAPDFQVYVIDNNSNDATVTIAQQKNVPVLHEYAQGKAFAIRTAFREIDADIYVMIDGDDTYPLNQINELTAPIITGRADMTVGDRHTLGQYKQENKRRFHNFGNSLVKSLINILFKAKLKDILSGYRAFNKRFVKNYPVICEGFELEADLTIHALHYKYNIVEVPISFQDRPEGSFSKLNTFTDGIKIIRLIVELFKNNKPMMFFSTLALIVFLFGMACGYIVIKEFIHTHFITHMPLAILSSSSLLLSFLLLIAGLILDTLVKQDLKNYALGVLRQQ